MLRKKEKKIGKVLVVDDDMVFCTIHSHIIKQTLGLDPEIFERAEDAIQFLDSETLKNELSLILLDLNMPGMNGWDFLEIISGKHYSCEIIVIIVTSSPFREDYDRSKNYGRVVQYLTKPLKKENFRELLNRQNIVFHPKAITKI